MHSAPGSIKPAAGVDADVSIERTLVTNNFFGIVADGAAGATIHGVVSDSVVSGNVNFGITASSSGGLLFARSMLVRAPPHPAPPLCGGREKLAARFCGQDAMLRAVTHAMSRSQLPETRASFHSLHRHDKGRSPAAAPRRGCAHTCS